MEVLIDGIKFIPETDCGRVVVRGISYDNIPHWLLNIEAEFLHKFVEACKKAEENNIHKDFDNDVQYWRKKIDEFEMFCKEYLGFERINHEFVEITDKNTD